MPNSTETHTQRWGADPSTDRPEGLRSTPQTVVEEDQIDTLAHPAPARRPERVPPPLRVSPGELLPGTRYRVIGWLGEGGMGVVYEAEHVDLGRRVALKILRYELCRRPQLLEMFRQEARTLSRVGSRYIVDVTDFAELADGRLMFTMEWLDGKTLREELEDGPMALERVVPIVRQVCKGLMVAHAEGIVHRDIKPDNVILVRREGKDDHVKLLDFGIAAVLRDTERGTVSRAGTPRYLAPEAIARLPYDGRADLYAVGSMAYEMLSGESPFDGEDEEVLAKQLRDKPVPLRERRLAADLPSEVEDVVMQCLATDPSYRYRDAVDLEAAICEAQIAVGLQTRWDDLPVPDVEPRRRQRLSAQMPDPRSRSRRRRRWLYPVFGAAILGAGMSVGLSFRESPVAVQAQIDAIEQLTIDARAAAARAFFIYPAADDPRSPTAYRVVLRLEHLDDPSGRAQKRAQELRGEFGATLVRLGDEYWEAEGGKPFAIDYYAAALVFVPQDPQARERGLLSPGELVMLRKKAKTQDFTRAELEAVEPLVVLAEPEPEKRRRRLAEMRKKRVSARSSATEARLDRLVGDQRSKGTGSNEAATLPDRSAVVNPPVGPPPEEPPADPEQPQPSLGAPSTTQTAQPRESEGSDSMSPRRKKAAAKALVAQGSAALDQGKTQQAKRLFERALSADGRSAAAYHGLSRIQFEAGSYVNAARLGQKAVRLQPRNAGYRLRLGDAYYKSFRYSEARKQYLRAKVLGSKSAVARIAKVEAKLNAKPVSSEAP